VSVHILNWQGWPANNGSKRGCCHLPVAQNPPASSSGTKITPFICQFSTSA
jgi:hypothetical protein